MGRIKSGELIDVSSAMDSDNQKDKNISLDLYVKSLYLKYPLKPLKTLDKLNLMKSLRPMLTNKNKAQVDTPRIREDKNHISEF